MIGKYIVYTVKCGDEVRETAIAELADAGFEGFLENADGFTAYIAEREMNEEIFSAIIDKYAIHETAVTKEILDNRNWNEEWERNFEPILVDGEVIIRAPFHKHEKNYRHELVIQPKNTFGTGHHETTQLMISLMLAEVFDGKQVFDYGSGTGVLGILASRLGAAHVYAIDIDDWSEENIRENLELNKITNFDFSKGDLSVVKRGNLDLVLANINKNILLRSFSTLSGLMSAGAHLLISGFYESDLPDLKQEALTHNLHLHHHITKNEWCAAQLKLVRAAL